MASQPPTKPPGNPITPAGLAALRARYDHLLGTERPAIVEIVSWAAGNGDRSENGDYLYGRKRMREIDRELAHLARRMKAAKVIEPSAQPDHSRAWFGATVLMVDEDDRETTVTLVGDDEQDPSRGLIGWSAPIARALRGAAVGDLRTVRLPGGQREWEVLAISYPNDGRPLSFRGGVGVGSGDHAQPAPERPHPPTPSPEGEGV